MPDINLIKVSPNLNIKLGKRGMRIGILNRGKNNKFVSNTFKGLEIAIQDEGENTLAEDNKIE